MRIAICISGFIRTWKYTKNSFKNYLCNNPNVDVFIHTYKQNYFECSSNKENEIYSEEQIAKMFEDINVKTIIVEDRDDILKTLNLENDILNNSNIIKESSSSDSTNLNIALRIYDQVRKIELCNNLKKDYENKNGFKYDIVVRTRFDILYLSYPRWNLLTDNIMLTGYGSMGGYPSDCVSAGKNNVMDIISNRYSNFYKLVKYCNNIACAHGTLSTICKLNNIKFEPGFIETKVLRSESLIHIPYINTISVIDISDFVLQNKIIKSMFSNKVLYSNENIFLNSNNKSNIVLVSSMMHIKNKTSNETLCQLLITLKTIRDTIPNSIIILLEGTKIDTSYMYTLYKHVDYLILYFNDPKINIYLDNFNKSYEEVYKLLQVIKNIQKYEFDKILKISNGYYLNNDFSINNFSNEFISGKILDNKFENILYSVPKKEIDEYINILDSFLNSNSTDIETFIPLLYKKINNINLLGIKSF